jgi:hypothetical protein
MLGYYLESLEVLVVIQIIVNNFLYKNFFLLCCKPSVGEIEMAENLSASLRNSEMDTLTGSCKIDNESSMLFKS